MMACLPQRVDDVATRSRGEEPLRVHLPDPIVTRADDTGPEARALLADSSVMAFTVRAGKITAIEALSDLERLNELDLAVLDG
jgi:hypothetical protein